MIYLLYGKDNFLKEQYFKKVKKQFGECENGINYIMIDENTIDNIISDIETPAFGYPQKMIVAKYTKAFTKKNPTADKISEYLKNNILDDVEIVFIENEIEKNSLYNTITKIGTVKDFNELKMPDLIKQVISISKAYNVSINQNVAQYLIECVGSNMQDIINELRKLIEYAGNGGTINKEDIDSLTIKKTESIIFDLTDNLGKKNIKEAIDVLHNLVDSREPLQVLLIMLYRHFKKLYITQLCKGDDVIKHLNLKPNQTFLVRKYTTQANYFKNSELESILKELIYLDEASKNGNIDLNIGLETVLCRYCS